jgi:hypothetical protein
MPVAVFVVVFAVCLGLAAPGLTWLDGGELALAAGTMGVAHPPGEPAYLVLAKLAALVPIGDLPFRLTLLSAVTVAAAAAVLAALVADAAGRMTRIPGAQVPLPGLVAGLAFGLTPAVILQGVRPELYGLAILLGVLSVRALQHGGRVGVALAVIPLAVAGAVHHAMLVAAIPGLVLLASGRGRRSFVTGLGFAALFLLPALGLFGWLPLRSMAEPALDFGSPRSWERIVHHVTAAGYARSFRIDGAGLLANSLAHLRLFFGDLGPAAMLLAAFGALGVWQRGRTRDLAAAALLVGVGVLPTVLQGLFREDNPDARGYLLGCYAVFAAGAGFGTAMLIDRVRARSSTLAPWLGVTLLAAAIVPGGLASMRLADHAGRSLPARLGAAVLDDAAPGSLVLLGGDSWAFPALYLRYWERRRVDVHLHPLHMLEPAVLPTLAARGFPVPAELTMQEVAWVAGRGPLKPEAVLQVLVARGVPIEVNEVWLPPALLRLRRPRGLLYALGPDAKADPSAEDRLWTETAAAAMSERGFKADLGGQGVLSRRYGARGGWWRAAGDSDTAGSLWSRGSSLETDGWAMIQVMRYRFETGREAGPYPAEVDRRAHEASVLLEAGKVAEASALTREVLSAEPTHHEANLLSERLYSLGYHASPTVLSP